MLRRIVLVGLGHAHLHVVSRAARFRRAGLLLTLIDDGTFWYSSIGSGLVGGRYGRDDDVIEAAPFAARHGIDFVPGRATAVDRAAGLVLLEDGSEVPYDLVSLNVGSRTVAPFPVDAALADRVWTPKPIRGLLELGERLARAPAGSTVRLLVVGGNHSGCELACNAAARLRAAGAKVEGTLVTAGDRLVPSEPRGASRAMAGVLRDYGFELRFSSRVDSLGNGDAPFASLSDGTVIPFDLSIVATGLTPSPLVEECGLAVRPDRGLRVTAHLHAPADDRVFAAGDCAAIEGYDLPKVGVFGVRAAPVLADNLMARAAGRPMRPYRPQRIWFAAQNLGDGTGLASWGPLWWRGRSALALKDWNDRRFMALYRD